VVVLSTAWCAVRGKTVRRVQVVAKVGAREESQGRREEDGFSTPGNGS
jgi:hypothetical protein